MMCTLPAWYGGKGFGMVEGLFQDLILEVQFLTDKRENLDCIERKVDCRAKEASEEYYKAKTFREAVILRKNKHQLIMCQNGRDKVRMMQKMEELRMVWQGVPYSFDGSGTSSRREVDVWRRKFRGPQWDRAKQRDGGASILR